jgi:hypothetical protein
LKWKVKARSGSVVPSQAKRQARQSIDGRKWSSNCLRSTEFRPSAASTRSLPGTSASVFTSRPNTSRTPSCRQRSWKMFSRWRRERPQKPWPVLVTHCPPTCVSMSVQYANCALMAAKLSGSACSKCPSVSSLNTTPQPKVSSARLRS